jgi:hypothetical protein
MDYEYEVAISFAGEDRKIAKELAEKLKNNNIKVFFDEYEEAKLLGENLYEHFTEIYSNKSRFCVMLISTHYRQKAWTNHERKSAQDRAFKESKAYILPVRLDQTPIPGLLDTVAYFDLRTKSIDELVQAIGVKLGKSLEAPEVVSSAPIFSIPAPKIKKITTERDRDKFNEDAFAVIKKYFNQGITEINKIDGLEGDFSDISLHRFSCKIYSHGKRVSECTIWFGSDFSRSSSICYSNQANQNSNNSMNDTLSIEEQDGILTFKALMRMYGTQKFEKLTAVEAAEYLWHKLTESLNR